MGILLSTGLEGADSTSSNHGGPAFRYLDMALASLSIFHPRLGKEGTTKTTSEHARTIGEYEGDMGG